MTETNQINFTNASSDNPYPLIGLKRTQTPFSSKEAPVSESESRNKYEYSRYDSKNFETDELLIDSDLKNNGKFLFSKRTPLSNEFSDTWDFGRQKEKTFDIQSVLVGKSSAQQQIIQPLRDYKRKEILYQAVLNFNDFQSSLNTPEAAMHIHLAKKKLEESWDFIAHEDREIGMMISVIEDCLRQQKWHDYEAYQVKIIRDTLQDCVDGKIKSQKDVLERTSKLYKQDIDIFPSAIDEAYEEDE